MRGEVTVTKGLPEGKTALDVSLTTEHGYKTLVDEVSDNIVYIGEAAAGAEENEAVWRIQKIEEISSGVQILWAEGSSKFNKKWSEREGYSYS